MIELPASLTAALGSPMSRSFTAEIITGGEAHELGVADYRVSADAGSVARYTCELTVTGADPGLLVPYGAELRCWHVLGVPGLDPVRVAAGVYRLTDRSRSLPDGTVRVMGASAEIEIKRDRFTSPRSVSGGSAVQAITDLIRETSPGATVYALDGVADRRVAPVTYDKQRWGAIDASDESLAASIGATVYVNARGRFVIADAPDLSDPVVWTVAEGEGGVLVSYDDDVSDTDVVNVWVVSGERTDGTTPVTAIVSDDDPGSPTFAHGVSASTGNRFGRSVDFMSSPLFTRTGEALRAGRRKLARTAGLTQQVSFSAVPHPGLEPGDVVETVAEGRRSRRIIDSIQWSPEGMSATTRVTREIIDDQL